MKTVKNKKANLIRRHNRVRAKVSGTAERLRLVVFKSNKHIYAQLIDDVAQKTILAASDLDLVSGVRGVALKKDNFHKVNLAYAVGETIAIKALAHKIKAAAFDRGGNRFTGRVKAVADGARAGGLQF